MNFFTLAVGTIMERMPLLQSQVSRLLQGFSHHYSPHHYSKHLLHIVPQQRSAENNEPACAPGSSAVCAATCSYDSCAYLDLCIRKHAPVETL